MAEGVKIMYASLDFIDYKIEQRTKYSKAKVYTIIDDTETVIDLENPYIIKKRSYKRFFKWQYI